MQAEDRRTQQFQQFGHTLFSDFAAIFGHVRVCRAAGTIAPEAVMSAIHRLPCYQ